MLADADCEQDPAVFVDRQSPGRFQGQAGLADGALAMVIPAEAGDQRAMIVREAAGGSVAEPVSFSLDPSRIAGEVPPAEAAVDPGSLLEPVLGMIPVG